MKLPFYLIFLLIIASCSNSDEIKAQLQGDWKLEDVPKLPDEEDFIDFDFIDPPIGFTIKGDNLEYYNGFYEELGDTAYQYVGDYAGYKIRGRKIIFDRKFHKKGEMIWNINKITPDTIWFTGNYNEKSYLKRIFLHDSDNQEFDRIVFSTSGCYGTCRIMDISIDRNGDTWFFGEGYTEKKGVFRGKTNADLTQKIFQRFARANPLELEDDYSTDVTDMDEFTMSFIKDGKIIKNIKEYGREEAPDELIWSYPAIFKVPDFADFQKLTDNSAPIVHLRFANIGKEGRVLNLKKSEMFYLWTELATAKKTNASFEPEYTVELVGNFIYSGPKVEEHHPGIQKLTTNGQLFKLEYEDNLSVTYDLGYNFFERNFKDSDFRAVKD